MLLDAPTGASRVMRHHEPGPKKLAKDSPGGKCSTSKSAYTDNCIKSSGLCKEAADSTQFLVTDTHSRFADSTLDPPSTAAVVSSGLVSTSVGKERKMISRRIRCIADHASYASMQLLSMIYS